MSTKNITDKGIDLSEINYVTKEFHAKNKKSQIFSNDLLIARHGNSGSAFLIPETVSEAQALNVVIIKNSKNFDSYFMENYFETTKIKKYMASLKAGSVQGVVNTKDIEKISINLPSFNEQNKINSFLQLFDRKIQLLENQYQICLDFKKYLMQQIFTQKLRFDFNEEWQEIQLKDIGTFYRGHSYNSTNVVEEGLLVLRSNNIKNNNLDFSLSELQFVNKDCKDHLALQKNDIVICMSNGTRKLVGKSAQYMGNYNNKLTVGAFCSIFRTKNKLAKYLFQTEHYKRNLYLILAGTNINNLKNSDLEKFKFNIPTNKMEINKIYNLFNALDKKIDFNKNKLDEILLFKKGLLQQMFV